MARLREPDGLRKALAEADLTQAQLSRRVGCVEYSIRNVTRGRTKQCSTELALAIEEALGLYPGALFVLSELPSAQVEAGPAGQDIAS